MITYAYYEVALALPASVGVWSMAYSAAHEQLVSPRVSTREWLESRTRATPSLLACEYSRVRECNTRHTRVRTSNERTQYTRTRIYSVYTQASTTPKESGGLGYEVSVSTAREFRARVRAWARAFSSTVDFSLLRTERERVACVRTHGAGDYAGKIV